MARPKKKDTVESQLRNVVAQALEEGMHNLVMDLVSILAKQQRAAVANIISKEAKEGEEK